MDRLFGQAHDRGRLHIAQVILQLDQECVVLFEKLVGARIADGLFKGDQRLFQVFGGLDIVWPFLGKTI